MQVDYKKPPEAKGLARLSQATIQLDSKTWIAKQPRQSNCGMEERYRFFCLLKKQFSSTKMEKNIYQGKEEGESVFFTKDRKGLTLFKLSSLKHGICHL